MEGDKQYYKDQRALASDNIVRSGRGLDNIIFAVTTGAIILSIGLLERFPIEGYTKYLISASLVVFLLALLLHSFSYILSIKYNKKVIRKLDEWNDDDYKNQLEFPDKNNIYMRSGSVNNISFGLMVIGVIFLMVFMLTSI